MNYPFPFGKQTTVMRLIRSRRIKLDVVSPEYNRTFCVDVSGVKVRVLLRMTQNVSAYSTHTAFIKTI